MMRMLVGLLLLQLCTGLRTGKDMSGVADDSCTCLEWHATFENGSVACGDAFEFSQMSQWYHGDGKEKGVLLDTNVGFPSTAQEWMDSQDKKKAGSDAQTKNEICSMFLQKITTNHCVKVATANDESKWYGKSWCYVSSKCQSLNGGVRVEGKAVSAKMCTEAEDDMLGEMSPTELKRWYDRQGLVLMLGLAAKSAYPFAGDYFKDLNGGVATTPDFEKRRAELEAIRAKGKPVVYSNDKHSSSKMVVVGKKLYKFGSTSVQCKEGCEDD